MRKRAVVRFVAALALVAGCSVESVPEDSKASSDAAALSDADVTAVRAQVDAFVNALLAKNWAAYGQTLTTDYISYPPNQPPVRGRDANLEYAKTFPTVTAFTVDQPELGGTGDVAYGTGTYRMTLELPDKTVANDDGSYIALYRKQSDGTWQYWRLIWHSDAPLPTAPPAR
jgi:ketosteroid isomerase-like protein